VIAVHDDEIFAENLDPHLGYKLVRSGTYVVKARLWAHPSYGGTEFTYKLKLTKDNKNPTGDFTVPLDGSYLPETDQLVLSVNALDSGSGISRVEFLYHNGDWAASNWQLLGTDLDGSDGWTQIFDVVSQFEQKEMVFFANIFDWAGNWIGTGAWKLGIDFTPPITSLLSLAPNQSSTAVKIQWTSNDIISGINHFDFQSQIGFGSWVDFEPEPSGNAIQTWFVGQPGINYGFRLRGVDNAGNSETYPTASESRTTIPSPPTLCSMPDVWDAGGGDNSALTATQTSIGTFDVHNFCNPLTVDRLDDEDWVRFPVKKGEVYIFKVNPEAEMSAASIELFAANGITILASAMSDQFGSPAEIKWNSDRNSQVYLRVRHTDGRVAGNIVAYQLILSRTTETFLPIVNH
jgi:hypothetical protein